VAGSPTEDPGGTARPAPRGPGGLSIDEEGRLLVHGEPVTHARTLEVLWRSLERLPDGSWQVRVGAESAAVAVSETPWAVRSAVPDGGGFTLWLPDGSREPLDPGSLRLGRDGVLRCTLANGCRARFTRAAQLSLGAQLEEDASAPAGFRLKLGGQSFPLGSE